MDNTAVNEITDLAKQFMLDEQKKEATAGTVTTNELLMEILDQQKRQTYLLAFQIFNNYDTAADYMLGKELYIPKKLDLE